MMTGLLPDWYQTDGADSIWFKMSNCNTNYDYYNVVDDYRNLNSFSGTRGNMMDLDNNERCTYNVRLIYDDVG